MPELPEVETIRRDLEKSSLGKVFHQIDVVDPFVLRTPSKKFIAGLKGKSIKAVHRRGKALLIELSGGTHLLVQLMMTGQLVVDGKADKHSRIVFKFTDKSQLLYNDQRRFGQLRLAEDLTKVKHLNSLGPEPLGNSFNARYIFDKSRAKKKPVKNLLLDHTFVAGIGNIYACEILFRCKINPERQAHSLSEQETKGLYQQTVSVLEEAIKYRGSSMRNYRDAKGQEGTFKKRIQVYARESEACFRCASSIKRVIQAGRSTFYCAKCQS